jgi:anti-anti-sigma regulatory factor
MSHAPVQRTAHSIGLSIGREAVHVHLSGDIDLASGQDLSRLMNSLDLLAYMTLDIDMSAVTLLDSDGIRPLVAATRRREQEHLPPVRIGDCSPMARSYLHVSGLEGRPRLDLQAWDRIGRSTTHRLGVAPLAEDDTEAVLVPGPPSRGTGAALSNAVFGTDQ